MRLIFTLFHRWAGIGIAGFLMIAGITGSLLAWIDELEMVINPNLFVVDPLDPSQIPMDILVIRDIVEKQNPHAWVMSAPLKVIHGHSVAFFLDPKIDQATGNPYQLNNDQVFIDPYSGRLLGERKWGDITQGKKNLMPFIYRLHYSLALGQIGKYFFGFIALLWVLNCLTGAYLTFPAKIKKPVAKANRKYWLERWRPSWKVRWRAGLFKFNFDLHRAGGLWLWGMLLVISWSAVSFNLPMIYKPIMNTVFSYQPETLGDLLIEKSQPVPGINWLDAREHGRRLIKEAETKYDFKPIEEDSLSYNPSSALYRYSIKSSRDIRDKHGRTSVYFDANNGKLKGLWVPTGVAIGDTVTTWITSLHMADVGGRLLKAITSFLGVCVTALSVTGLVIWMKKRNSRNFRHSLKTIRSIDVGSY